MYWAGLLNFTILYQFFNQRLVRNETNIFGPSHQPKQLSTKSHNWVGKASAAEISDKSGIFVSKGAFTLAKFVAEKPKNIMDMAVCLPSLVLRRPSRVTRLCNFSPIGQLLEVHCDFLEG
jgi:hypothetical protein